MSSWQIDQYVYNVPSNTVIIFGLVQINSQINTLCLSSPIEISLVFNSDISQIIELDPGQISLVLYLICPNEKSIGGQIQYSASQFFSVNSDNPILRQIIPNLDWATLPEQITIRMPTQKLVYSLAESVNYSKCLDYFTCKDHILTVKFPSMIFTSYFNFKLEFKTKNNNLDLIKNSQILKYNCGKTCFSKIVFSALKETILLKNIADITINQKIICFYPYNHFMTKQGWKEIRQINSGDIIFDTGNKNYQIRTIYRLPIFNIIQFVLFPQNCFEIGMPSSDCYLTPEHMVSTVFGQHNAKTYSELYQLSHGIKTVWLYTDYIYSFEVASHQTDIYVNYDGLPARVWSLDEKRELKRELEFYTKAQRPK